MDNFGLSMVIIVRMWTGMKTAFELMQDLADAIRVRRVAMGLTQQEAAQRSGIAYRTWRRLETQGKASIEDLIKATLALRCEEALTALFAEPVAASLDDLLKRQVLAHPGMKTVHARAKDKLKAPQGFHPIGHPKTPGIDGAVPTCLDTDMCSCRRAPSPPRRSKAGCTKCPCRPRAAPGGVARRASADAPSRCCGWHRSR